MQAQVQVQVTPHTQQQRKVVPSLLCLLCLRHSRNDRSAIGAGEA